MSTNSNLAKDQAELKKGQEELAVALAKLASDQEVVAKAESKLKLSQPKLTGDKVRNVSPRKLCINHIRIKSGEIYELNDADKADESLMAKVDRMVALKVLISVSD